MRELLCLAIAVLYHLPILSLVEARSTGGFTIELIHHDSPLSPFYNSSATPADIFRNAALRSISRLEHFRSSSINENAIESTVIPNKADYLMKLSIGTPPVEVLAIADTGSDLIWIQCTPCEQCYPQDSPLFDPTKSSSYNELSCGSEFCQALDNYACSNTNGCEYKYSYGDESHPSSTSGVLATDTFTFDSTNGQTAAFPKSAFGCGHNTDGKFSSHGSGLVGLGGGPLSLVSQLAAEIEHKFSYCLLPMSINSSSKLSFGNEAIISGEGLVSTPLMPQSPSTFYYLTLENISIGKKTVQAAPSKGNIIIDSGTTFTMLESSFYNSLEAIVREAIDLASVQYPSGISNLCYEADSVSTLPDMIFNFVGAELRLKPLNTFVNTGDLICLAIVPSDDLSIFGCLAQANFQVEYDLEAEQVSFVPTDCTQK